MGSKFLKNATSKSMRNHCSTYEQICLCIYTMGQSYFEVALELFLIYFPNSFSIDHV